MALSMLTSLEIFANPRDLVILVGMDGEKWGFAITRGPGHNFKALVDSNGFADTKEAAIEGLKGMLEVVSTTCTKEFENQASVLREFILPEQQILDQSEVLNPELIGQIITQLGGDSRHVKTYDMLTPEN